jgi:hypothetical protein
MTGLAGFTRGQRLAIRVMAFAFRRGVTGLQMMNLLQRAFGRLSKDQRWEMYKAARARQLGWDR